MYLGTIVARQAAKVSLLLCDGCMQGFLPGWVCAVWAKRIMDSTFDLPLTLAAWQGGHQPPGHNTTKA